MNRLWLAVYVAAGWLLVAGCTPPATSGPTATDAAGRTSGATSAAQPTSAPSEATQAEAAGGDPQQGAELFTSLPCAGCHGATAGGQFGPTLAGTGLDFGAVQAQVRAPRDKMPAFSEEQVSDAELRHIYAWLQQLPTPTAAPEDLSPAAATQQALDGRYPPLDAEALRLMTPRLDELTLQVRGRVRSVVDEGRFTRLQIEVGAEGATSPVELQAIYDTALAGEPFPAAQGDTVTLYGVGANPKEENGETIPMMQVLEVRTPE